MLRRRRRVAARLRSCGLLPDASADRTEWRRLDPLRLRGEALDRPLEPSELARVLLSFADRRGFKSNRQTDGGEDGKVRKDNAELQRRIEQSEARTLGEYLWRRRQRGETVRARLGNGLYPERSMIERELEAIQSAQAPHHPLLAAGDWDFVIASLLHQRPLRPVERGWCTLLEGERRILKAEPLFQYFRILQEVNNVEVTPPGESHRPLTDEERRRAADKLRRSAQRTFEQLTIDAGLPEGTRVNLRSTAREKLDGDLTAKALRSKKCFGSTWNKRSIMDQQLIVERLLDEADTERLIDWLIDEHGLDEAAAEGVSAARLPPGTGNLSKAAIERLLPHLKAGMRYPDAVKAAGLGHHSDRHADASHDLLPYYGEVLARHVTGAKPGASSDAARYGRVANPTVHIALGQVRRLFNAIVHEYGKPSQVVVELSRDLKQTEEQRREDEERQRQNRARNERLRDCAARAGFPEPSAHHMRKLRLWEEQGKANERICPFTGTALSIERVLSAETEIEHLLPYSRSLDNSMNNTVVAMRSANRDKANRTPFEAWGSDQARYGQILAWAKSLPRGKRWRFEADAIDTFKKDNRFLERQLNENRYLSRLVREYLECAVDHRNVWVTPGRMTALLRRAWGLESVLTGSGTSGKNREDHRHHMIDAAVVGMTSRSLLQRIAHASGRGVDVERIASYIEPPWPQFRSDVQSLVDSCVVRHRPDHFTVLQDKPQRRTSGRDVTSGGLHNDTAYGIVDGPDDKGMMTLVERKDVSTVAMNPSDLERVRDRALRVRLRSLWERVQTQHPSESEPQQWQRFVEHIRKKLGIRRLRLLTNMKESSLAFVSDPSRGTYKAYKTDGNAYMDIWLLPNSKTKGETVSRFHAHDRTYSSEIKRCYPTARKIMRLHRDDMMAVGTGDGRQIYRVLKLSGQSVFLVEHQQGGPAKAMTTWSKSAAKLQADGFRKISVDILGRVRDSGPPDATAQRRPKD